LYIESSLRLHFVFFGLICIRLNMIFSLVVGGQRGQRGHHIRYAHSKASELHLNLGLNFIDICVLKAFFFCILFSFGLILVRWNMQFGLVVGGQRGHHIRYAHS
jgi:hypothetical protein